MMHKLSSEQEVLEHIGITDWKDISKENLGDFIAVLPDIDKDVTLKIIEQFPEFSKNSLEMINTIKDICYKLLEDDKDSSEKSINAYKDVISDVCIPILDELRTLVKRDDISAEDRKYFTGKMIELAQLSEDITEKIAAKDSEGKMFKQELFKSVGGLVAGVLLVGAGILGLKYIKK